MRAPRLSPARVRRVDERASAVWGHAAGLLWGWALGVQSNRKTFTYNDLVTLGRAGRPWEFLGVMQAGGWPDDAALTFLVAANFARLGLRTLAAESLGLLGPAAQAHADVAALRTCVEALPIDLIPLERRAQTLATNLAALAARAIDLSGHMDAWRAAGEDQEVFAASDGNVVWRRRGTLGAKGCGPVCDEAGSARALVAAEGRLRAGYTPPVYLEGANPPWLFQELARATERRANGFCGRVVLVQADPVELLHGLSLADVSERLSEERVDVLVGADATLRLGALQRARLGEKLDGLCLRLPGTRTRAAPPLDEVLRGALGEQDAEAKRLVKVGEALYRGRDSAWWAERFAGRGGALRVLIPSCRCTTFVRHSATDLAAAFGRAGHEAQVLLESADWAQFSTVEYLRAFERLEPDLVVLINYPRALMGAATPPGVPYICWVQDAMPHLFDARVGSAQGPLDFVVGHAFTELFGKYGYPIEGAMPAAVVADAGKFHPGPVDPALASRLECELAFVSHHGETPEAMHARLTRELARDARVKDAMDRIFPLLGGVLDDSRDELPTGAIRRIVEDAFPDAPAQTREMMQRHYAVPLADRIMRHQTLAWASELAQEKGWRLHVYGRGWEGHPTLSRHARGELTHDEELRGAYVHARLHLHTSLCSMVHQRVLECALSGGLCLARFTAEALVPARHRLRRELLRAEPDLRDPQERRVGYLVERHGAARELVDLLGRMGRAWNEPVVWISESRIANYARFGRIMDVDNDASFLFPDLASMSFSTRDKFRAVCTRAVEDVAWREGTARAIAARVRERLTHDALVPRLIELVRDRCAKHASVEVAA